MHIHKRNQFLLSSNVNMTLKAKRKTEQSSSLLALFLLPNQELNTAAVFLQTLHLPITLCINSSHQHPKSKLNLFQNLQKKNKRFSNEEENETPFLHLKTLQMSIPTTVLPVLPTTYTAPPPPPPISTFNSFSNLGLGYAIAIALGFLVILSAFLIASYLCRRRSSYNPRNPTTAASNSNGVMLPSIIFVAEDGSPNQPDSPSGVVGLDAAVINSYPRFEFTRSGMNFESAACSICLCDYKEGEMLRMMPDCRHSFHLYCLDAWLRLNGSCPVCRNSPLPTPISTPLAEVVPLTQFGDNRRRR